VVIGTTTANRHQVDVEPLIGLFANTLVLRTDLTGNPRFRDLLMMVKEDTLSAYEHQHIPFELLVKTLNPSRALSHNPLFQLMFILDNNQKHHISSHDLHITPFTFDYPVSKFDLTIFISEIDDILSTDWEYATDLFNEISIQRMGHHFSVLLRNIITNPDARIDDYLMLMPVEQHELVSDWSSNEGSSPQHSYVVM
jgi:non-ribosomal peptide synthetase component F